STPLIFTSLSFSFTAPPPTVLYTLSLHDALPIYSRRVLLIHRGLDHDTATRMADRKSWTMDLLTRFTVLIERSRIRRNFVRLVRSEEHTSELQSRGHLVCRLLLEKKKKKKLKNH